VRQSVTDLTPLPTLALQTDERYFGEARLGHQLLDDEGAGHQAASDLAETGTHLT
jgi:hypothetical protein